MPGGDLKTFWTDYPAPMPDAAGDDIPNRGGDPLVEDKGGAGLDTVWTDPPVKTPDKMETANSVSGLPLQPSRQAPSPAAPPPPPDLNARSRMTIDER